MHLVQFGGEDRHQLELSIFHLRAAVNINLQVARGEECTAKSEVLSHFLSVAQQPFVASFVSVLACVRQRGCGPRGLNEST